MARFQILLSLKGSDSLAWGAAPGDRVQRNGEPHRGDIDLEDLHVHNASTRPDWLQSAHAQMQVGGR